MRRVRPRDPPVRRRYGQTAPGGIINVVTRQPDVSHAFGSAEFIAGQWDNYTAKFDYNVPVVDKRLAVRLSGSHTDSGGRRDGYHQTSSVIYPALTWRPTERTAITVSFTRDQGKFRGILATGLPPDYAHSTASFNYLNQNYETYYDSLTPEQRVAQNLQAPAKLVTAQAGGPSPIFRDHPYEINPAGDAGTWNPDRKDYIFNLKQVLVDDGAGVVRRSDLQVNASRINDKVEARIPLIDGQAPQGSRGVGIDPSYNADMRDPNYYNWTGALWAQGFDYNYANPTPNAASQAGYYYDASETTPGAKNFAGSGYYYTPDLTQSSPLLPLSGPHVYEYTIMPYRLELNNDVVSVDDVTQFDFGHTQLRLLVGAEYGRQDYYDYNRKGQLPLATGNSTADQAQNAIRNASGWSATAWGLASGNGVLAGPEWGYSFTDFTGSNGATLYGAGADRAYRGWYLWDADTGRRVEPHLNADTVAAFLDQYYYGLVQEVRYGAVYSTAQLDLFDKKVSLLGALRYSAIDKYNYSVEGLVPQFPQKFRPVAPQGGIVYNLTPDLNLYASYSNSYYYQWSRGTNQVNDAPPMVSGDNYEIGSKFAFLGGRVSGAVALYESTFNNLTVKDYTFDLTTYDPVRYPQLPTAGGAFVDQYGLDRFNGATRSRGVELNFQLKPTDNTDILVSYSHMKSEITRAAPWMVGLQVPGLPADMASVWGKYSFKAAGGRLAGLSLGLGATYNSPTWVGYGYNVNGDIDTSNNLYWQTPTFLRFDGVVSYTFKLGARPCYAAVNVKNLFDRVNWTTDGSFKPDGQGREFSFSFGVYF